jgi:hypothetical protein
MSSLRSTLSYNSNSTFDELRWVIQVRKTLEEEFEDEDGKSITIFNVPKLLMASDPDSYVPQQVAIGPYHYWRPELYEMQSYKLAATKRFLKSLQTLKLDNLVDQLTKLEQRVRSCYHKYLDLNCETVVWMMIVDASFLLELLQIYAIQEGAKREVSSSMSYLVDYAGGKSAHNATLRDFVMLENQIPLCVLRKMLEFKFSSKEAADEMLIFMFIGLFKQISPFKMIENFPNIKVSKSAHLLDFFYEIIVPKLEIELDITIDVEMQQEEEQQDKGDDEDSKGESSYVKNPLHELWMILSKHNKGPMKLLKRALESRPLKLLVKIPLKIITYLPGGKLLKQYLENIFSPKEKGEEENQENENSRNFINKPPLIEEITIPCVKLLMYSGVNFSPTTNGSISNISFDANTGTFYLPIISLDVNTEVFLRNLVAYESSVGSGPLVITRYTELMNGIIDSADDAKILREKGIILNHLKSDQEVANMWNGMSKSLRLSKVPFLDKTIEDVNKYYNNTMKIKMWKFIKSYVFGSWKVLTFLATIFLLFMTAMQAFCSVYTCHRFLDKALEVTSPNTN